VLNSPRQGHEQGHEQGAFEDPHTPFILQRLTSFFLVESMKYVQSKLEVEELEKGVLPRHDSHCLLRALAASDA
jgi:hypothetical protein